MRKLTQIVLVAAALMASPAFAEMKVAVLNYQMALLESDSAKKYAVDAEKKFGPQLTKLKTLESDAKRIQDRLVKEGEKMQQAERERLELEFKQKARDFQFQSKELNEAKAVADREMLKQLKPKLDQAVEEVLKKGSYDLVLEQTFFCALDPSRRGEYVRHMHSLIRPGGHLAGVLFNRSFDREGPPFGGSEAEYRELFAPYFDFKTLQPCYNSHPARQGAELFINFIPKQETLYKDLI